MNLIRSLISVFLATLLVLSIAGWNWAGSQPSPKSEGARTALVLCGLASLASLWALWTTKQSSVSEGDPS